MGLREAIPATPFGLCNGLIESVARTADIMKLEVPTMTPDTENTETKGFQYSSSAELYVPRNARRYGPMQFKRFDAAAEAIRFAMEELPRPALAGIALEVDERRYTGRDVEKLYDDERYPLPRRALDH